MRYYSVDIFVNAYSGKIEAWGSAPAFGMVNHEPWKPTVRQCILTRPDAKVFVNVYNRDISIDLIKRIAGDYVANAK